ncbi:endonuclease domain-containing protein [Bradyrhizobium genosp. P]|uniref:endonuclease domain-containing protein n=1 Tax=Bradyrhizobium genosp. P TaxID=83641 RepID=UPI003CF4F3FB
MSATPENPTSPCKGEVDREAGRWGSRFSRTKDMTARARSLRVNMTEAESRLWRALRRDQLNGFSFRKQHPIGPYTLDFYCSRLRLAVEVDGGQHAEQRKQADDRRTAWLAEKGATVVRYWNNDVLSNLEGVLSDLLAHMERLSQAATTPTLPLSGGGRTDSRAPGNEGSER